LPWERNFRVDLNRKQQNATAQQHIKPYNNNNNNNKTAET